MEKGGIYIHVPFCRNKCLYCDFYTGGVRIADWDTYIKSILNEFRQRREEVDFIPRTLYIGGGTPSLIPIDKFKKLIKSINRIAGVGEWEEFTIEVNPEDVSNDNIHGWKDNGANRISIGIQSLNDNELKTIGRSHNALCAINSLEKLVLNFENISADLMFGIPGQTIHSYNKSLEEIIKYHPSHISSYSLMLEEGTALTHLAEKKRITLPDEEEWLEMFSLTTEFLKSHGYLRYEISNYSFPGFESRHNSSYWHGNPYLGLGPGAHSYNGDKIRRANPNDIKGYLNYFSSDKVSEMFYNEEILKDKELKEEMIMTRLRTSKGLNRIEFINKWGTKSWEKIRRKSEPYIQQKKMKEIEGYLSFTDKGFIISDVILSELI